MKDLTVTGPAIALAVMLLVGAASAGNRVTKGAPDTDTRNSPSVSPNLDGGTASSGEGQTPSTELETNAAEPTESPDVPMQLPAMTSYMIDWHSVNGGGTVDAASTNYRIGASIGQAVAGAASSPGYQMGIGFWYGATGGGGCSCPCKYDPECDGVISDVLDVTRTINVAFRGQASIQDPDCPVERSDVDANQATDVIDVTKVINVAFRGQQVATNYVDPCL